MPNIPIHPKYQKAVEEILTQIQYEKKRFEVTSDMIAPEEAGVTFGVILKADGIISEAFHFGAQGSEKAILEKLCAFATGKPIQEVSDHGIIYVENGLRDPLVKNPVDGLLSYYNADNLFVRANALVRKCYALFQQKYGVKPERNFWTSPPKETWTHNSSSEKKEKIKNCISEILTSLKVFNIRFEVLEVIQDVRVVVSVVAPDMKGSLVGHWLMKVEKELKNRLEPKLELILEDIEDRNKRMSRTQIPRDMAQPLQEKV